MSRGNPLHEGLPMTAAGASVAQHNKSLLNFLAVLFVGMGVFLAVPSSNASSGSGSAGDGSSETPDPDDQADHDDDSGSGDDVDDRSGSGSGDDGSSGSGGGDTGDDEGESDRQGSNSGKSSGHDDELGSKNATSSSGSGNQKGGSLDSSGNGSNAHGKSNSGSNSPASGTDRARVELRIETKENSRGERVRRGEVVVVSSRHDMAAAFAKGGFRIIEVFSLPSIGMNGYRISVPPRQTEESLLAKIRRADPNSIASFNHVYSPAGRPTLAIANVTSSVAPAAITHARIGLVDARVNAQHPMLRTVHVSAKEFGLASSGDQSHGTAVASRIAEVAPGANIVVASVFSELQNGDEIASVDAIARGLDWLSRNQIPVINLSLTGPANPVLQAMTSRLIAKGHVLVAAVGNEGPHAAPQYPAAYDGVVGVTAVDEQNKVYLYANQGAFVDFAAPGVNTYVATASGSVEIASGTSYAAPVVAVALAKLLSRPDEKESKKAQKKLADGAKDLGEPGRDPVYGFGVIQPSAE